MGWFFLGIFILMIIAAVFQGNSNRANFEKTSGRKPEDLLNSGTYVSGHPKLDNSFKNTKLLLEPTVVKIFNVEEHGFIERAQIEKNLITNVVMEDSSTIQNRVTVGRLLLTGIFAFAWKKKTKQECAYLIIEWNQQQFKNETIFEFEGTGSIQRANTLRNKFINYLTTEQEASVVDIPKSENDIYVDLVQKGRKVEAVNLYMHNNKVNVSAAQNYIESLG